MFSKEYIAKLVGAILTLLVLVLPVFGVHLLPDQVAAIGTVLTEVGAFAIFIYTMIRQKNKEDLTPLGRIKLGGKRHLAEK